MELFIECSQMTCDECFLPQHVDCGWCLESFSCSATSGCAGTFANDSCPSTPHSLPRISSAQLTHYSSNPSAVQSLVPATAGRYGGEGVTVTVSNVLPELFYDCRFGSIVVPATRLSATTFNCTVPALLAPTGGLTTVNFQLLTNDSTLYTPKPKTFTYYGI